MMAKQTPKQQRAATARKLEKMLPAKTSKNGETVVKDAVIRRAVRDLKK